MKVLIRDIPEKGVRLHFDSKADGWFHKILVESLVDRYQEKDNGVVNFNLIRTGSNVGCEGHLSLDCHPTCSRCLKVFHHHLDIPFHLTLAPLYGSDHPTGLKDEEEVELVKEDLEFTYYEGDQFDLGEMIREQLILELPMQPLCGEDCKGLCSMCGANLNESPCSCPPKAIDLRWTPLQRLKSKQ